MGLKACVLMNKVVGVKCLMGSCGTTPKGYIPISVGMNNETKRFMVHTTALGDADFKELLRKAAEEYGFNHEGVLRIPYEANAFEELMIKGSKLKILRVSSN